MALTLEEIQQVDPKGMYQCILDFPKQSKEAVRIGSNAKIKMNIKGVTNIVLSGLGGSAIGGDLLKSYLLRELSVPFTVNRHYVMPDFVNHRSLVIISSYSGNTEETIAAYKDAMKRKARILCISTGGEVLKIAQKNKHPFIKIPGGLQPRAALGYSFFPLLVVLASIGMIKSKKKDIEETLKLLMEKSVEYGDPRKDSNVPLALAEKIVNKLPVIYSPTDYLDAVNVRWRGQIAENAKQLAFGHVLPEMNHNELVGWNVLKDLMKHSHVVFLRDKKTHTRIAMREEITKKILSEHASGVSEVWTQGDSLLARMFSLVHLGDWMSFYLAILNKQNPEPVAVIDFLKSELAKVS
jgi:glucose/mannose-6-phosphate isomerase